MPTEEARLDRSLDVDGAVQRLSEISGLAGHLDVTS